MGHFEYVAESGWVWLSSVQVIGICFIDPVPRFVNMRSFDYGSFKNHRIG